MTFGEGVVIRDMRAGLRSARAQSRHGGWQPKLLPQQHAADVAKLFRVHRATISRVVQHARALGATIPDDLLAHVAPLGWEHIVLTGDYVWANSNAAPDFAAPDFRPLRDVPSAFLARVA